MDQHSSARMPSSSASNEELQTLAHEREAAEMVVSDDTHFTGHKFRVVGQNFWNSLESSSVWFAAPASLNDPFDWPD
jgi:hypothetical protein